MNKEWIQENHKSYYVQLTKNTRLYIGGCRCIENCHWIILKKDAEPFRLYDFNEKEYLSLEEAMEEANKMLEENTI